MNFFDLINATKKEVGIAGPNVTDLSTVNAEMDRVVGWVRSAYVDVQKLFDTWKFMKQPVTIQLTPTGGKGQLGVLYPATATYIGTLMADGSIATAPVLIRKWDINSFKITQGGRLINRIWPISYDRFEDIGLQGNSASPGMPQYLCINPFGATSSADDSSNENALMITPTPDQAYTLLARAWMKPFTFTDGNQQPIFSSEYHEVIMYKAMQAYAEFTSAPEVMTRAVREFNRLINRMVLEYIEQVRFAPPLA